jgi:hypothetical protein
MPTETTAQEIVDRIVKEMTAVLKRRNKQFSTGATGEWETKLLGTVGTTLSSGRSWPAERPKVLLVAKDMARIATMLSSKNLKVNKAQVHAAFRAVKEHVECPGRAGSGRWCDFNL